MRARLQGLRDRDWRVIDRAIVVVFAIAAAIELATSSLVQGPLAPNILLYCAMAAALLWRRDFPLATVALVIGGGAIGTQFLTPPPDISVAAAMLIAAIYSVGAHADGNRTYAGLAIGLAGLTAIAVVYDPSDVVFPMIFFGFTPWFVGRVLRSQLLLAREQAERVDRVERERGLEESRAIAEERRRVARELHDVLAHDLSVIVVQAAAAGRIIDSAPERAAEAAELIGRTGREALAELRHVFGPVRRGEGEPLEGSPSVARVGRLAQRAREAGLPVELRVEGEPRQLPAGVDLTGYRVVQEALTNALRHARAASASVLVRYEPEGLVLEVSDDGLGPAGSETPGPGGGHGLVGMRERVALYGGELEAGRRRGGGFAVRAHLPLNGALS